MSTTLSISGLDQLKALIIAAETISEPDRDRYLTALEAEDIPDALRLELADVMDREADFHAAAKQEIMQEMSYQEAERAKALAEVLPEEEQVLEEYKQQNEATLQNYGNDLTKIELAGEKAIETEARGDEGGQIDALKSFLNTSKSS